ncbi:sensor domain-containing protein [Psychromonas sp. L1A2]|uniref:sensor domain-containing protein n=1 Tax=Psychromonas sp. L1A2 TaxID=2686356 RepID=UPI00135873B9|nr:EAL domain-containing protein [Psychromonas sp. L1A2]
MRSVEISNLFNQNTTNDTLHQLFDAVDAISVQGYDEERRVIYWNAGSEKLYGFSKEEALGEKIEKLIIPTPMSEFVIAAHNDWVKKDIEIPASEIILRDKDGHDVNVFSSHVMFTNQFNKRQMYCVDINLTDVRNAEAQVVFKEHMLETIFEATPDLFFLMERNGSIIDYYASNHKNLFVSPNEFVGKSISETLPANVSKIFDRYIKKVTQHTGALTFEYELTLPHGLTYFEARMSYLPQYEQILTIVRDITEQHKSSEVIRRHAYYDTLTLLPNRFLALDRLSQMIIDSEKSHKNIAVFFLDLDDFKKVNDSLGHEVGDKLLIEAALRLTRAIRKEDTIGRLGGDEFIVLSQGLNDENDPRTIADNLLKVFREPFQIDGRELILTLSIGIAVSPENGYTVSDLLRNADTAMYQAKSLGRNAYSFFTKEMNIAMIRRFEIEEQMHGALERDEFEVYYQPQLDVKTNKVIGAEALLRWHSAALGNITPDEFIPIAEHTGLIVVIGQYVVKQALNFLHQWQTSEGEQYTIAVNLSPRQFRDKNLIPFIKESLDEANIEAGRLELEITEGVLMTGQSYISDALLELQRLGVKLSMDDFGTGYSSLSYLRQYDFDVLKIDRSFINGITQNKEDRDLVKASIAIAHSLGLDVVAEGVEITEQLTILKELNCDYVQGYYFSKPMPAGQFIDFSSHYKEINEA